MTPGEQLRAFRESLHLKLKDVAGASERIADRNHNSAFAIPASRLSEIELRGLTPSIYRMYSLAVIYGKDMGELLRLYGIEAQSAPNRYELLQIPATHPLPTPHKEAIAVMPIALDPSFDPSKTAYLKRIVQEWGPVPMTLLQQLSGSEYAYGYVGRDDCTMWPLIRPGAFLQIDRKRRQVLPGYWANEYERPLYFVETRDGFTCCWCAVEGLRLVLLSHPLSPVSARVLRNRHDANVIGMVTGVAQRLVETRNAFTKSCIDPHTSAP
jgi:transcriptional regulator with XRE-family HTH domain